MSSNQLRKLMQPINPEFKPDNKEWVALDEETINKIKHKEKIESETGFIYNLKNKHLKKRTIEDTILDVRELIFRLTDALNNKENPIKLILSEDRYQFACCVLVITIGTMLLLLSNILK